MKINLAVIFGSRSCEHDVSVISGLQAAGAADKEKYRTILVYIDRQCNWYTGDRLMELFRQAGAASAYVNLGGNVQVLGSSPDGDPWRIGIRDPEGEDYAAVVEVTDQAVVTSGAYERYFEQDGVRYGHIIDPSTGYPADSGLASVTIVSPSGTLADALSTALFVMGPDRAAEYWRGRDDFDFILIGKDGSITISEGIEDSFSFSGEQGSVAFEVVRR